MPVRSQERQLGVGLLERTTRQVRLTAAGEVLLRDARTALEAVTAAARRTQEAGSPSPQLDPGEGPPRRGVLFSALPPGPGRRVALEADTTDQQTDVWADNKLPRGPDASDLGRPPDRAGTQGRG